MKKTLVLVFFTLISIVFYSQKKHHCQSKHNQHPLTGKNFTLDTRSDSINILHTDIAIDLHAMDGTISAHSEILFEALVDNISEIQLDLLDLTVDSVTVDENLLAFDHDMVLLTVQIPNSLMTNDLQSIIVHYHGEPTFDPSGIGGFRFIAGYAFNLGVGFTTDPHPFGRSWFPCFDNFVERSTYSFSVLTDSLNYAYCNGEMESRTEIGVDSMLTIWNMENTIPSYLTSIGVSTYTHVQSTFNGVNEDIESFLIAKPADTTDMKNSFINLPSAFATYENHFGPFRWQKIAYNLIPNTTGAMEHATNVAYPKALTDGSLTYQYVIAHELAHHWWGDLVTCSTQEDMWINEGMASYCEQLFFEDLEGEQSYIDHVRDNHKNVFLEAHDSDGAWLPVSGIGWENTYGSTVYNKGSDVAHVMRSYLGDGDFFGVLTNFLEENQFSDVSSEDLRDFIIASGVDANMMAYFDNWIFNPGFPEFSIKSYTVNTSSIELEIVQQLHHAPTLYTDVPLIIRTVDSEFNFEDYEVIVSGESSIVTIPTGNSPEAIFLNPKDKISQAAFGDSFIFENNGVENFDYSEIRIDVNELGEANTMWMHAENHFADGDLGNLSTEYKISEDRFWRIHFINSTSEPIGQDVEARIKFNGNESSSNYRDETFFIEMESLELVEDSLILFHRENGNSEWEIYNNYELSTSGINTNWVGTFTIFDIESGDYAWGYKYSSIVNISEKESSQVSFTQRENAISINTDNKEYNYYLYNSEGKLIDSKKFKGYQEVVTEELSKGTYVLHLCNVQNSDKEVFKFILK